MTTSKPADSIFLKYSLTVIRLSPPSISLKFRAGVDGLKHSLRSCRIASFEKSTPRHGIWTRKNGPMWSPSGPWNGVMLTKAQPSGFSRVRICSRNCRGEDTCSMTASATTTSYVQSPVTLPSPQTKLATYDLARPPELPQQTSAAAISLLFYMHTRNIRRSQRDELRPTESRPAPQPTVDDSAPHPASTGNCTSMKKSESRFLRIVSRPVPAAFAPNVLMEIARRARPGRFACRTHTRSSRWPCCACAPP